MPKQAGLIVGVTIILGLQIAAAYAISLGEQTARFAGTGNDAKRNRGVEISERTGHGTGRRRLPQTR